MKLRWTVVVALICCGSVSAEAVLVPVGTPVYGELEQSVTSKKKDSNTGDVLRAHAWRDVVVDNRVVIKAGAPMIVRVSKVQHAKVAGRKGDIELEAVSVKGADGKDILLDGGYDKSGKGRIGLSVALFALVAWPLIFIKGKQAELAAGTVFDCRVQNDSEVGTAENAPRKINLTQSAGGFTVEVLYDDINTEAKVKTLPLRITACSAAVTAASIVTVNDAAIAAIPLALGVASQKDNCNVVSATADLEALSKHFKKGINRFEVEAGGKRQEVVLDIEI